MTLLSLASCANPPVNFEYTQAEQQPEAEAEPPETFIVTDYMNKSRGGTIPEWVNRWLDSGAAGVEAMDEYANRYVFVARNAGNNTKALDFWRDGFLPELDFPRMAAARVEARFSAGVSYPGIAYGAFFEDLIRAASDTPWRWMAREDDFWIRRRFVREGDESENWEYLILVTIEKTVFTFQLDSILQSIQPNPPPGPEQAAAIARVRERFYDGF